MSQVDFGAVQLKEIHLHALDEMGDDGAETLPKASRDFCCRETRNRTVNRGDTGEKDFKKKKSKSLQDGLVHNYTYYTYGLLVVFLLCRGGDGFFQVHS